MYAYCNNNPVSFSDPSGLTNVLYNPAFNGGGGCGMLAEAVVAVPYVGSAIITLTLPLCLSGDTVKQDEKVETKTLEIAKEADKTKQLPEAVFFGVRIYANEFKLLTPPMNFNEAEDWAYKKSKEMGIGTSWGLYTEKKTDAYLMAIKLSVKSGDLIKIGSVLDNDTDVPIGFYRHYHPFKRIFNNKHKAFHLWYGSPVC